MTRRPVSLEPDPVIEYYKQYVDRSLLRENLKLTPEQRLQKLERFLESVEALREAAKDARPVQGK